MDAQWLDQIKILLQSSKLEKWDGHCIPKGTDLTDSSLLLFWRVHWIQSVIVFGLWYKMILGQGGQPAVEEYGCASLKAAAK